MVTRYQARKGTEGTDQEEIISKIKAVEDDRKNRIGELQIKTTVECQRNKQEVLKKLEERHKEIQNDISDRVERVYTTINKVDGQPQENKEKIKESVKERGRCRKSWMH